MSSEYLESGRYYIKSKESGEYLTVSQEDGSIVARPEKEKPVRQHPMPIVLPDMLTPF